MKNIKEIIYTRYWRARFGGLDHVEAAEEVWDAVGDGDSRVFWDCSEVEGETRAPLGQLLGIPGADRCDNENVNRAVLIELESEYIRRYYS